MLESHEHPSTTDGALYLNALPVEQRRENGLVYTSNELVGFILDLAGFSDIARIENATVLDPACGAGVFLTESIRRIASRLQCLGATFRTEAGRTSFIASITRQVFGVDVDPRACQLARASLQQVTEEIVGSSLPPSLFARNIVEADFLTTRSFQAIGLPIGEGFDFIVGNPPYVSATRIKSAYKQQLRDLFSTATGRLDLYMLFMERATDLLLAGGRLAFITPDKFLSSQTARPLRSFILQRLAVLTIARFSSHKVFEDAATVPCVSVFEKSSSNNEIEVLHCRHSRRGRDVVDITRRSMVSRSGLTSASWDFVDPDHMSLARRIRNGHPPLECRVTRVSAGPATGRDSIYVVPSGIEVEPELLHTIVRGKDILPYRISPSGSRILVPYAFDESNAPNLINLADFPLARRYLQSHREELEQRHCVKTWEKPWYDWHDRPACNLSKSAKIVVPDLANSSRFAVDAGRFWPVHSVYYLVPRPGVDPFALSAILNSSVSEFLVRLLSPVMKDGFSRYRQQFLLSLPVPDANEQVVDDLAHAAREGQAERVEELVAKLFQLSDAERLEINRFVVDRASQARENDGVVDGGNE